MVRQCVCELVLFPLLVFWSTPCCNAAIYLCFSASRASQTSYLTPFHRHNHPNSELSLRSKCSTTSWYQSRTSESKRINMFDYEDQLGCLFLNLWRCRWIELWKIIFLIKRISEAHLSSSTPKREHLLLLSTITILHAHMYMHSHGHVHIQCKIFLTAIMQHGLIWKTFSINKEHHK